MNYYIHRNYKSIAYIDNWRLDSSSMWAKLLYDVELNSQDEHDIEIMVAFDALLAKCNRSFINLPVGSVRYTLSSISI